MPHVGRFCKVENKHASAGQWYRCVVSFVRLILETPRSLHLAWAQGADPGTIAHLDDWDIAHLDAHVKRSKAPTEDDPDEETDYGPSCPLVWI